MSFHEDGVADLLSTTIPLSEKLFFVSTKACCPLSGSKEGKSCLALSRDTVHLVMITGTGDALCC